MRFTLLFLATTVTTAVTALPTGETPPPAICLAICYFEKPDCGADGYAERTGECWTCCRKQTTPTPPGPGCPAHY
ncbi:hypothetical protein BKA66DRAFT_473743 [Pyrenochaeta sp. MPI-SDFR-AT-0127]|nr:hypothetical protein BKA66DRAFT_473743 [Pyrenochaeta sp. MPI-SDFR-AT-0127]